NTQEASGSEEIDATPKETTAAQESSDTEGSAEESDGPDNCSKEPCKNGGTCVNDYNRIDGYQCNCQSDFGGINCDELKCRISLAAYASKICLIRREIGRKTKKMLIKLTSSRKDDFSNGLEVQIPLLLKKGAASFVQSASTDPFTIEWYMKMTDNADLNKDIESHFTLKDPRFHTTPTLLDFAIVYEAFYKHHKKRSAMSALKRVPSIEDNFFKDRCFSDQRLAGANPYQIWKVTKRDEKEGISWESMYETKLNKDFDWHKAFHKVLGTDDNDALDKAIDKEQVFVTYYPELNGIKIPELKDYKFNHTVLPLTAPIAFFVVKENEPGVRRLSPVAIQLNMDKDAPVSSPDDQKAWFFAKSVVQRADINVLHLIKKRLKTHLYMDAPCTLVEKYFSEYHPLHQILRHHCRANLETNKLFELKLYGPKAPIYKALSLDFQSALTLVNKEYANMTYEDIDLIKELKKRGVYSNKTLPYYPYRDDGIKLYNTISKYVADYINLYYKDDDSVANDYELQDFANEMSSDGKGAEGGLGMEVAELSSNIASIHLDQLMDYYSKLEDPKAKTLVQKFYDDLDDLSKSIIEDNDQRVRDGFLPYPYFLPGYVTNSIST
ncbi:hypothetical protein QZH41_020329, partial [Actinostola sp. cb2023]